MAGNPAGPRSHGAERHAGRPTASATGRSRTSRRSRDRHDAGRRLRGQRHGAGDGREHVAADARGSARDRDLPEVAAAAEKPGADGAEARRTGGQIPSLASVSPSWPRVAASRGCSASRRRAASWICAVALSPPCPGRRRQCLMSFSTWSSIRGTRGPRRWRRSVRGAGRSVAAGACSCPCRSHWPMAALLPRYRQGPLTGQRRRTLGRVWHNGGGSPCGASQFARYPVARVGDE